MNSSIQFENDSKKLLILFRKINIYSCLFVVIIGFIGNLSITYIYSSKKRCTNSSHVYLLFSSVNDNLFLILHLIEDTLKTYLEVYSIEKEDFLRMINLTDMNNVQCQLISYLRNILRFVSAYIVVAFTLQRLLIVYKPLTAKFKDIKSAWIIILIIIIIGILFNIWTPFIFTINNVNENCDVDKKYPNEYFYINLSYIVFALVIPMILILISNFLISIKIKKSNIEREKLQQQKKDTNRSNNNSSKIPRSPGSQNLCIFLESTRFSKTSCNLTNTDELVFKKSQNKTNKSSNKLTLQLSLVSISFFILYLPYLIGWFIFYYNDAFSELNLISKNKLFSVLQFAEILYILYYGIKFYIFFLTSSEFRNIFTRTSKFIFFFAIITTINYF
jgi:hypothetical protein